MKRIALVTVIGLAVIATGVWFALPKPRASIESSNPTKPSVTLVVNGGDRISTYSGILARTAFEALELAGKQGSFSIATKQYDFGLMVEKIGTVENTKEKSWIYFVNGLSGQVASDKYETKPQDIIEWKYIQPMW